MKAIGIMSGTSLDGIDICLVNIHQIKKDYTYEIEQFKSYKYRLSLINKIKEASKNDTSTVQKICSLNYEVAYAYVEAIQQFINDTSCNMVEVDFIAMHGQTIWHNPNHMDGYFSSTLQIGEPAVIAYAFNKKVISNFRTMDMAAGGSGAPLIPFVNYQLYKNQNKNIAFQNIGGIGNVCYLKKNSSPDDVIAFDTGPGNMLIDGAMQKLYHLDYDAFGNIAKKGKMITEVLDEMLEDSYLYMPYPKSTGREKYNDQYLDDLISKIKKYTPKNEDVIATITAYTAYTIIKEYQLFLPDIDEIILSGGGAHNKFLVDLLRQNLSAKIIISDQIDAYEAFGFAILGHMTILNQASNLPSVTGAKKAVILGNITNPPCEE
ncbi:MAG: anhydro-N-acetylmuramic acid kinase [Staphylococcus sp.]|nr:anhydro-N-acetylmuramic acid kinase [Staphylococcus sp.]